MTVGADAEFARKLFAGPCDFFWGTGDINSMPPEGLPEIAFVGRSNAGKSSLINALTGRKTVARVSHTPGRTREINFFNLGGKLNLVDLPGYGYAKASKELAMEWQNTIFAYLAGRASLRRVALLIDSRRGVMDTDLAVMELLDRTAVSYGLVLTKTDELKPAQVEEALAAAATEARRHTAALEEIHATSSRDGAGLTELRLSLAGLT
ncbi:MAG: YihA family ribosome biogenesis GTP-binding protein [Alphaproteobacteria bacterium]|nr:YihA family ribosome biogenesis GTP-binding protein [Alphaproteobacteria bacterium]